MKAIIICLLVTYCSFSQTPIVYSDPSKLVELGYHAGVFIDEKHEHTIESIQKLPDLAFKQSNKLLIFDTTPAKIWLKFNIENRTMQDLYFMSYFEDVFEFDLFSIGKNSKMEMAATGIRKHNNGNFENLTNCFVHQFKNQPKTLYVSTYSLNTTIIVLKLGSYKAIAEEKHKTDLFIGLFIGIMFITFLYNLALYFFTKDSLFLYYSLYVIFSCLAMLALDGKLVEWLWRIFGLETFVLGPFLNPTILIPIGIVFIAIFSSNFLNSKALSPVFYYLIWSIALFSITLILFKSLGFFLRYQMEYGYFLIFIVIFFNSVYLSFKGFRPAYYFLFAWGIYIIGAIIMMLGTFEVLSFEHFYIVFGYHFGAMAEAVLMSVAIVKRIMLNRQEINDAKELAYTRLNENEKIIEEHNQLLRQNLIHNSFKTEGLSSEKTPIKKINIPTTEGVILFPIKEVVRLEALGSYTNIHLSNSKKVMASKSIGEFEPMLDKSDFLRVHKSHIININFIERYIRGEGGMVIMPDGAEVSVSRTMKGELLERLNIT